MVALKKGRTHTFWRWLENSSRNKIKLKSDIVLRVGRGDGAGRGRGVKSMGEELLFKPK